MDSKRNTRSRSRGIRHSIFAGVAAIFLASVLVAPITETVVAQAGAHKSALEYAGQEQNSAARVVEVDIGGVGKVRIPDLVLRDQEGRQVRFYSDLIKDKVVVLSFFYTTCTYTCTMQGRTFSKLQSLLGERLGKSVFLISVTTDPVRDNSERLKAWGSRYNLQPGWTLVTGEETEMNKLLIPFTGNSAGGEMHLPSIFIGNDTRGLWTSATGVFAPEDLLRVVDFMTNK